MTFFETLALIYGVIVVTNFIVSFAAFKKAILEPVEIENKRNLY